MMSQSNDTARAAWMGLLARAEPGALAAALTALGPLPAHEALRAPQIGLVMARGRAGATGGAFNLGEVSATRCTVRLGEGGAVGTACVLGRDKDHARNAALADALMQTDRAAAVRALVLAPLARAEAARRGVRARKAAATKVEFFTLVRGSE
jgi:alpha-D-ribose 1-methylphosphonate 5-triphosphate synthase subunit PhnG